MLKKMILIFFVLAGLFYEEIAYANENVRYVKVDGVVNMRSEPTTDSLIVYQLKQDMPVTLLQTEGDWSYLSYNGVKGYLKNDYLIQKEEVDTTVKNFSYHTFGYHTVTEKDQVENIAFLSKISTKKLLELNQLKEKEVVSDQILKLNAIQYLKGKRIVIDSGHGGNEAGASAFGIKEGEETLALGLVVKRHLEREGAQVFMTVDEDFQKFRRMSLRERASFAKRHDADLFVSLHYNINENPSAKGTETYYNRTPLKGEGNPFPDESERLANYLQQYLVASIGTKNLGAKDSEYHVLRNNTVPSVLIEVAFLSNEKEVKQIQTDSFKEKSAYGITQGIVHYFE